jgi:hypothetical protein
VRVKGVTSAANAMLHPWLKAELTTILATLPEPPAQPEAERRAAWERWQAGLTVRVTLPERLPPLRLLLVLANLTGHKTPSRLLWLVEHGVMPLDTPLSGAWLNMAESIQRILVRRALTGATPASPDDIIAWLEATARGWNTDPTPFEWAGKRQLRRQRSRQRHRHALGGSGACARRPVHHRPTALDPWRRSCQVTHQRSFASNRQGVVAVGSSQGDGGDVGEAPSECSPPPEGGSDGDPQHRDHYP